jgi:cephalosporin hydroxylase
VGLVGLNVYQYLAFRSATTDAKIRDRFQQIFAHSRALFKNRWLGIKTLQHPFDAWITQEIIFEVKPDFIVETGTFLGGSAVLWATILEHANPDGRIITVDIRDGRNPATKRLPISQRRVEFLHGSSTDPELVSEIAKRVEGKTVLVILDSLHEKHHVLDELRAYSSLVSVGSYIIVQDTVIGHRVPRFEDPKWMPGAWEAVHAFLAENDNFVIDARRERLLVTNNADGFLKRVR